MRTRVATRFGSGEACGVAEASGGNVISGADDPPAPILPGSAVTGWV